MRKSSRRRPDTAPTYIERVNLAIDRIHGNLDRPIRLRDLSRAAMLSPHHFHRIFHAIIGETPADFVKRQRLEKALRMMSLPEAPPLTRIAHACGFASSADFTRSFKQRFGVPPSRFDIERRRTEHFAAVEATVPHAGHLKRLPSAKNPDAFRVKIRELPARTVAYIRVSRPYEGDRVFAATQRLIAWAEKNDVADRQWLGFQWENPEVTALEDCSYSIAVESDEFRPCGEIGRYRFRPMKVAEIEIKGGVDLELRALQWFYGSWLPRSRYVPDDLPGFEAMIGRPFAHGLEYFELLAQIPIIER